MPELPEVETIKSDLEKSLVGRKIVDVNFLWNGILKEMTVADFKKIVIGQKVKVVGRRAKNLYLELEDGQFLLIHLKMTGHLIFTDDCWKVDEQGRWLKIGGKESPMYDPLNQFIRVIFSLDKGKILAFSDLRKFAYLKLVDKKTLNKVLSEYGPEPFSKEFTPVYLKEVLEKKKLPIKKVLMDQALIAGIGNIYADEILWESKIHPLSISNQIPKVKVDEIYHAIKKILNKAIELRGTSTSDFRDTKGKKGKFGEIISVYRRNGLPCQRDGRPIKRITLGSRGTHFCDFCQVRYPNV